MRKIKYIKAKVSKNPNHKDSMAQCCPEHDYHWVILRLGWTINHHFPFIHRAFVAIVQKENPMIKERQGTLIYIKN